MEKQIVTSFPHKENKEFRVATMVILNLVHY